MLIKKSVLIVAIFAVIFFMTVPVYADVIVTTEGVYSNSQLTVNIYVDTTVTTIGEADPLVNYGVKLNYPIADLNGSTVSINDTDWYFGSASSPLIPTNAEPVISTDGEIILIGGLIDEPGPTVGVSGDKVLLASIIFNRISENVPALSVGLGKTGNFANFVTNAGDILDGSDRIEFLTATVSPECNLVGDFNGDRRVDRTDLMIFRENWATGCP